jgi:exopolyphosphatase
MTGELGKLYGKRLSGCIDHHDEENKVPKGMEEEPRIVQICGSCSSLVVQYCREAWDSLAAQSRNAKETKWNAELARLALAPVLIDTSNLKDESKTTPNDVDAVKYLEKWIASEEKPHFDAEEYFKEIADAEKDVDSMSLADLLRKDYKEWNDGGTSLGICSVVKDMSFVVEKAGGSDQFLGIARDFAKERNISVFSVMTRNLTNNVFTRELLVWGLDEKGAASAKRFEEDAKQKLNLKAWGKGSLDLEKEDQWCRCWSQGKAQDSRKQIAPLLRSSMSS